MKSLPKPTSEQEWLERSLYLSSALALSSSATIKLLVTYCRAAILKAGGAINLSEVSQSQYNESTKELLCVSFELMRLEYLQSDAQPLSWLAEFVGACHTRADELMAVPESKAILANYSLNAGPDPVLKQIGARLSVQLGATDFLPQSHEHFTELISKSRSERSRLLKFSLTETLSVLALAIELEASERS